MQSSDLAATLERVTALAEESLDPELTREDLVRRMKDIANLADDAVHDAEASNGQVVKPC